LKKRSKKLLRLCRCHVGFHSFSKDAVDFRLVAFVSAAEPVENVGVQPQADGFFAALLTRW